MFKKFELGKTSSVNNLVEAQEKNSAELAHFLQKVNFGHLRMIFDEYRKKAGIAEENWHFAESGKFRVPKEGEHYSFHTVNREYDHNTKTVNTMKREIVLDPSRFIVEDDKESFLLLVLVHEEVHAVSFESSSNLGKRMIIEVSGYNKREGEFLPDNSLSYRRFFRLFDEGVTELLAREITEKYLLSHPEIGTDAGRKRVEGFGKLAGLIKKDDVYQAEVDLVKSLIVRLSKIIGIDEKTVLEGIIRSKLEGFDFFEKEMKETFEDIFGEGFVDELGDATTLGEVQALTKKIEGENFSHDIGEVVRRKLFYLFKKDGKRGQI